MAAMVWPPEDSLAVVMLAVVVLPVVVSVPRPRLVVPSKKVTMPVGVPAPLPLTVAVKVTAWPNAAGLAEVFTTVVVLLVVAVTVWITAPLLLRKLLSPL